MSAHIVLTSHSQGRGEKAAHPIHWGAATPQERGPIIASLTSPVHRNAIGTHSGAYAIYRALAVASGNLDRDHRPDFTDTTPAESVGPHPQWSDPAKHRLARSLRPHGRQRLRRRDRGRRGHPPDHRHHQGAHQHARTARRPSRRGA